MRGSHGAAVPCAPAGGELVAPGRDQLPEILQD